MSLCEKCQGTGRVNPDSKCSRCVPGIRYAGLHPSDAPEPILREMENLAMQFALRNMVLRSAPDSAFLRGCAAMHGPNVIRCTTLSPRALAHAGRYVPAPTAADARDALLLYGDWFDDPVSLVVCYGPLRVNALDGVPVYDLAVSGHGEALREWLTNGK